MQDGCTLTLGVAKHHIIATRIIIETLLSSYKEYTVGHIRCIYTVLVNLRIV